VNPGTPVALAAARHEHQKGLDILVEAFPKVLIEVPEARLLVAGREGSATEALRTKVKLLGLDRSVSFIGARDDIPDLLCATDVFVLPSRWEGFPGVLMEAMALATPIVASDLEGVREVLGPDGIGVRVRPGDTEALAGAIRNSVSNGGPGRPEAAGRKRFLSSFTIEAISDQMGGFYRRVIGKRR
jgi:glycosyltransferase involved in cell wall biosynthesis